VKAYLRVLGIACLILGLCVCIAATRATLADETYYRTAGALERHQDHILFQAEYQAALARHTAYIVTAVVSGVGGVLGSAILLGIAAVIDRQDRAAIAAAR
jgi:hypothetical protein